MPDSTPPPLPSATSPRRSGLGCFAQGCLITIVVLMLLGVGFGTLGYYFVKGSKPFITTEPVHLHPFTASDQQYQATLAKLQPFAEALNTGRAATVELTAEDLNTLLDRSPDLAPYRDRVFFDIVGGQLVSDLNVPIQSLDGSSSSQFISARLTCDASFSDGRVALALRKIQPLQGELPAGFVASMLSNSQALQSYSQTLSRELNVNLRQQARRDPQFAETLARIRTAVLQGDHLVVTSLERPNAAPLTGASPVATPAKTE